MEFSKHWSGVIPDEAAADWVPVGWFPRCCRRRSVVPTGAAVVFALVELLNSCCSKRSTSGTVLASAEVAILDVLLGKNSMTW